MTESSPTSLSTVWSEFVSSVSSIFSVQKRERYHYLFGIITISLIFGFTFKYKYKKKKDVIEKYQNGSWDYDKLKLLFKNEKLPLMIVDIDLFDENVKRFGKIALDNKKTIRLATKSLRVPALIQRVFRVGGPIYSGLLCFSVEECAFLAKNGLDFDDFLVAYPTVQKSDLNLAWQLTQEGKTITLMIDSVQHVDLFESFWAEKITQSRLKSGNRNQTFLQLRICIDYDMSYRLLGGLIHLGAHRSPIHTLYDFSKVAFAVTNSKHLKLVGVMGYEAQIAGLPDSNPFSRIMNPIKYLFKSISASDVRRKRQEIKKWLIEKNINIEFFNGGGSGNIKDASLDFALTEIAAGSGFLQSSLFDYYVQNENQCAFIFALQYTRNSSKHSIVCQSGGFIASGEISGDKQPVPFLPKGLKPYSGEGFGEVQTPLSMPDDVNILIGDPIFFRPAKAGEIAENFNEYILKRGNQIVERVKTYRGYGQNFF